MHLNHLFIWMDPEVVAHDKLIAGKTGYLNVPFFLLRAVFFLSGWSLYRYFSRKFSLAQDSARRALGQHYLVVEYEYSIVP